LNNFACRADVFDHSQDLLVGYEDIELPINGVVIMISVNNLIRTYGDFTAVNDVSFEIEPGEIVGLLGHNGAGKTTIMKMMTGYLEPTGGSVTIDGLSVDTHRQQVQSKIGYLPENCPVYPEMSILSYLEYCAALRGIPENERGRYILEAINRTALHDKATQQIATLSRGYRQRTGVAQAILHHPSILILDEPTNGLDPTQIKHMRTLIKELAESATVLISTHILQEVQAICDRVIIIKDGSVVVDSHLDELQKSTKLLVSIDAAEADALKVFNDIDAISLASLRSEQDKGRDTYSYELLLPEELATPNTAAQISKYIHEQGWKLYGMQYESRNLETVFSEIDS
jgi:ABC-2 type transport system ATP-binding protein